MSRQKIKTLRLAIKGVQSGVEKGETLSDSMKREECFPPLLVNMVAAGEMSGSMEKAIDRMALQFEKESRLKGMVKKGHDLSNYFMLRCSGGIDCNDDICNS